MQANWGMSPLTQKECELCLREEELMMTSGGEGSLRLLSELLRFFWGLFPWIYMKLSFK